MEKKNLFEHIEDPKMHKTIDSIIQDLCEEHESDVLEADIIALFEDIIQFFSGREEDFLSFDDMSKEQKEAIYIEITTIIQILKQLKNSVDKQEVIKIMSQNLIKSFSKSALKNGYILDKYNIMTKEEQERLKEEFAKLTMHEMYKAQQHNKSENVTKSVDINAAKKYLDQIVSQGKHFSQETQKERQAPDKSKISPEHISTSKGKEPKRGL